MVQVVAAKNEVGKQMAPQAMDYGREWANIVKLDTTREGVDGGAPREHCPPGRVETDSLEL